MDKIKKYMKPIITWIVLLFIYLFLLVILNYFQILKFNTIIKVNFIIMAVITFLFGLSIGRKTHKKGYLEGLKLGFIITLILLILNILFIRGFNLNILVYYLIIIVSSTFGSMIGINLKKR